VGLSPRVDLARKAGLSVNRGIEVNKYLQTSDPSIYALGDCAEVEGLVLMYVMPLMNAARALAKTLAGEQTAVHWPAMPVTVKTPACPVIAFPSRVTGEWQIDGSGANLAAVCRQGESVVGFALTGERIKERNTWLKAVPPLLAS
jgi:rubredoxin-NAD+ reductase